MKAKFLRLCVFLTLAPLLLGAGPGPTGLAAPEEYKREIKRLVHDSTNFHQTVREVEPLLEAYRTLTRATQDPREELDGLDAKYNRWKWYWQDRTLPNGDYPDLGEIYESILEDRKQAQDNGPFQASIPQLWTNINQTTAAGGYNGMGRTTDVAFHPSDPDTFFVGSPRGGVWKTTDGGSTYQPISDGLPFVSISNIAVEPTNANIMYAALGDHVWYGPPSAGIYKTTDGGASWFPASLSFPYASKIRVYDLIVHPTAAGTLYAATSDGLYKTTDGFTSHSKVFSLDTPDVAFRPGTPSTLYLASRSGSSSEVWKSTDSGANWTEKSALTSNYRTLRLATTPANPSVLGVLRDDGMFFKSTDSGESYSAGVNIGSGGQIVISAEDENRIYGGYVDIYRSMNGGSNWAQFTLWWNGNPALDEVHADQRNVEINPLKPFSIYWCNDGGLYEYDENMDVWHDHSDGLIITQYYRIANAQSHSTIVTGGTQDNGGRLRRGNGSWVATNGGDAMEVAIDPLDQDIIYTTYVDGLLYRTLDGWRNDVYHSISDNIPGTPSGEWVAPFELEPGSPSTIVAAYDRVWRSTDRGDSWTAISGQLAGGAKLDHMALSPTDNSTIYVAESGNTGDPYGGAPPSTIYSTTSLGAAWAPTTALPTAERVTGLEVSDAGPMQVFASVSGYTAGEKVFMSLDGGGTWSNISGSLPNVPANDIRAVPDSGNSLYVATDVGVYYRDDSMSDWTVYGPGLPMVSVVDIDFQESAELVRVGTHGRGLFEAPRHKIPSAAGYCVPQHVDCCNEVITSVSMDSLFHASGAPTSLVTTGYSNFLNVVGALEQGSTTSIQVASNFSWPDSKVGAWIDWNRNGTYEASEQILNASGVGPWSGPVTVPAGTALGTTTMRVRLQYGPGYVPDPCGVSGFNNGETEDYTIDVIPIQAPPPVPDGSGGTEPLRLWATSDGSFMAVYWDTSTCTATDYNLIYGPLATVGSYTVSGAECGLGTSGGVNVSPAPAGDLWFLMVGSNGFDIESNWGFDSNGNYRADWTVSGMCGATVRMNTGTCP